MLERGGLEGHASIFGLRDLRGLIVEPGAYWETLAAWRRRQRLPPMLLEHRGDPVGEWTELREDRHGLYVEGRLFLDIERGRHAFERVERNELAGLSVAIAFLDRDAEDDLDRRARRVSRLDLEEVSLVAVPANPAAAIERVYVEPGNARAAALEELREVRNEIRLALHRPEPTDPARRSAFTAQRCDEALRRLQESTERLRNACEARLSKGHG